jgi:hypothetical protein
MTYKTKQNKTKQNKTKQNKTKQYKKHTSLVAHGVFENGDPRVDSNLLWINGVMAGSAGSGGGALAPAAPLPLPMARL